MVDYARLDKWNGNTMWMDDLTKEMTAFGVAFEVLEDDEHLPVGYTNSSGHLILDVKIDFTRNARWFKDGHCTLDPKTSNYSGVISR